MIEAARHEALLRILGMARALGFVGPGPVEDHVGHSEAFVAAWSSRRAQAPESVLDLGSGGGVPGLVLASVWPSSEFVLLDSNQRRIEFLHEAVATLRMGDRVHPVRARAEEAARTPLRATRALVTARGFASPAITAECGAAFLQPGGLLAVAEPPGGDPDRWPVGPVASLGLESVGQLAQPATIRLLELVGPHPDRYPRRVGIPAKRPLWT